MSKPLDYLAYTRPLSIPVTMVMVMTGWLASPSHARTFAGVARDVAGFSEPGDDDPAAGPQDEIDGCGKGRAERAPNRRGNRTDAADPGVERAQRRLNGGVRVVRPG